MAIFRVEKTQNYTVMSNHHLRNSDLSLKAKGLLSQMLSLPDNWDYTLAGLSRINREKVDAIRTAVRELENAGYITRRQKRDIRGKMATNEYTIYEEPQKPQTASPSSIKPLVENPTTEIPTTGNPTQLNKEILNTDLSNIDLLNTDKSFPFIPTQGSQIDATENHEGNGKRKESIVDAYREIIKNNIEYDIICDRHKREELDEIVEIMTETLCGICKTIRVAGKEFPAEIVKSRFLKLHSGHIEFVFDCMANNTTKIRNIKQYLLAVLFNAPTTIDSYYTAAVKHDFKGDG